MDRTKPSKADDLTHAFQQVSDHDVQAKVFETLSASGAPGAARDLDMIMDLPVTMTVELGRVKLSIGELLSVHSGAILTLNAKAGDPLDIRVNGCLVARGEIVVTHGNYGIRLTEIVTPSERLNQLRH
jgi:flagellar motor switch protein FliN/FliY